MKALWQANQAKLSICSDSICSDMFTLTFTNLICLSPEPISSVKLCVKNVLWVLWVIVGQIEIGQNYSEIMENCIRGKKNKQQVSEKNFLF